MKMVFDDVGFMTLRAVGGDGFALMTFQVSYITNARHEIE
jgi:hypothetical protein